MMSALNAPVIAMRLFFDATSEIEFNFISPIDMYNIIFTPLLQIEQGKNILKHCYSADGGGIVVLVRIRVLAV